MDPHSFSLLDPDPHSFSLLDLDPDPGGENLTEKTENKQKMEENCSFITKYLLT